MPAREATPPRPPAVLEADPLLLGEHRLSVSAAARAEAFKQLPLCERFARHMAIVNGGGKKKKRRAK